MATQGNVTITGSLSNSGWSQEVLNVVETFLSGVNAVTPITLVSGPNTITIPIGATMVIGQLPVGNAVITTLKLGGAGDTGKAIKPDAGLFIFMITALATTSTFVLSAASDHVNPTTIKFI